MTEPMFADFESRLAYVNQAVYGHRADELTNWNVAERDQINAMAKEEDRKIQRYPVVHAWRTKNGSQLTFWCRYCRAHHTHGRHSGPGTFRDDSVVQVRTTPEGRIRGIPGFARLWKAYVRRFEQCRYGPGKRGICTCPMGSGDGHRSTHCTERNGVHYQHGYILHEVEPEDPRAFRKPTRR